MGAKSMLYNVEGDKEILVTDNLLSRENERRLNRAGFKLHRLARHCATEEELIDALDGKVGYILGGTETVSRKVLEHAKSLRAIVYNSKSYQIYIDHKTATKHGIAIANCPDGDSDATAEYALALTLLMTRNMLDLGRTGSDKELVSSSLCELNVGIIGMGDIGSRFAMLLRRIGVRHVFYYSGRRHHSIERYGIKYLPKRKLTGSCNIISIHTPRSAGTVLNSRELKRIKRGGLIVNVSYPWAVDDKELFHQIKSGRLRAAFDFPPAHKLSQFKKIPLGRFFWSNEYAGYNTTSALNRIGNMATESIINLLETGTDSHLVNPTYRRFLSRERAV